MSYEEDDRTMWFANWHSDEMLQFVQSKMVHVEESEVQRIEVIDTDIYGRLMLMGGEIQISSDNDAVVHEAMCHPPLLAHEKPKKVLIIGGGDGGSTRETLKHSPERVDLVEIDKRVIDLSKEYFPGFSSKLDDERVNIHITDGREFVKEAEEQYDVVIMDISDPKGPAKSVFSLDFYDELKDIMAEDGILVTHCESPDSSGEVFYRVISTLEEKFDIVRPYRHWVPAYIDFWGRVTASDTRDPYNLSVDDIRERLEERNIDLEWLTPELFHAMFRSLNQQVIDDLEKDWEPIEESNITFERP